MIYLANYTSPIGKLIIAVKNEKLIGLWIENQKYEKQGMKEEMVVDENNQTIIKVKKWLDRYFAKENPKIEPVGSNFRKIVCNTLTEISYGNITTYKEISKKVAKILEKETMSAQAVGQAIAHNPISIIIPCHRVIGTNKSLTGYAGGLDRKTFLLKHEQVDEKMYLEKDNFDHGKSAK